MNKEQVKYFLEEIERIQKTALEFTDDEGNLDRHSQFELFEFTNEIRPELEKLL